MVLSEKNILLKGMLNPVEKYTLDLEVNDYSNKIAGVVEGLNAGFNITKLLLIEQGVNIETIQSVLVKYSEEANKLAVASVDKANELIEKELKEYLRNVEGTDER